MSTIQSMHLQTLRKRSDRLARKAAAGTLHPAHAAELRALNWAIDTLRWSKDQASVSAAQWRETKLTEFAERRQNRRAKHWLTLLRRAVTDVNNTAILQQVDAYLASTKGRTTPCAK